MAKVITLTTDFGTRDGYVGAMKGVLALRAPAAVVADITHDVPPQSIAAGAWALRNAWPWFPEGTIHVVVVDPGVGSDRRGLVVLADGHIFVGPDNGVIPLALGKTAAQTAFEIGNPRAMAAEPSATFHGRDVFSTCAAWLAVGSPIESVGPPVPPGQLVRLGLPEPTARLECGATVITGGVQVADRFGNLVSNVRNALVERTFSGEVIATVNGEAVTFGRTFADVAAGEPIVYTGSSDYVEIAVNLGSAEARFGTDAVLQVRQRGT